MYMKETSAMRMNKSLLQSFENDEEEILILLNERKSIEMIKDAVKNLPKYILNFAVDPSETFSRLMKMLNTHIREFGMFNHAPFTWLECVLDEYAPYLSTLPNCKEEMGSLYKLISAHNETVERTKEQRNSIEKRLSSIVPNCIIQDMVKETVVNKVLQTPSCMLTDIICDTVLEQVVEFNENNAAEIEAIATLVELATTKSQVDSHLTTAQDENENKPIIVTEERTSAQVTQCVEQLIENLSKEISEEIELTKVSDGARIIEIHDENTKFSVNKDSPNLNTKEKETEGVSENAEEFINNLSDQKQENGKMDKKENNMIDNTKSYQEAVSNVSNMQETSNEFSFDRTDVEPQKIDKQCNETIGSEMPEQQYIAEGEADLKDFMIEMISEKVSEINQEDQLRNVNKNLDDQLITIDLNEDLSNSEVVAATVAEMISQIGLPQEIDHTKSLVENQNETLDNHELSKIEDTSGTDDLNNTTAVPNTNRIAPTKRKLENESEFANEVSEERIGGKILKLAQEQDDYRLANKLPNPDIPDNQESNLKEENMKIDTPLKRKLDSNDEEILLENYTSNERDDITPHKKQKINDPAQRLESFIGNMLCTEVLESMQGGSEGNDFKDTILKSPLKEKSNMKNDDKEISEHNLDSGIQDQEKCFPVKEKDANSKISSNEEMKAECEDSDMLKTNLTETDFDDICSKPIEALKISSEILAQTVIALVIEPNNRSISEEEIDSKEENQLPEDHEEKSKIAEPLILDEKNVEQNENLIPRNVDLENKTDFINQIISEAIFA